MSSASTPSRDAIAPVGAPRLRVLAWALWDWGTQPWNTVVTTFVFSVYLVGPSFGSANHTAFVQSVCMTIASVVIALAAPVLGQNTDRTGRTMSALRVLTWAVAVVNAALFLIADEPAFLWAGSIMLGLGTVASEVAGSLYNGVIARVSTSQNVGRVSGLGWGMGYLGGIVALLIIYVGLIAPDVGLFGVTAEHGMAVRTAMLWCGAWTLVFTIPTFLVLRDDPAPCGTRLGVIGSYRALLATIARLWRQDRRIVWFLLASALFRDGLTGIFTYGGALARNTFGFSAGQVVVFGAAANVIAGGATICSGRLDDSTTGSGPGRSSSTRSSCSSRWPPRCSVCTRGAAASSGCSAWRCASSSARPRPPRAVTWRASSRPAAAVRSSVPTRDDRARRLAPWPRSCSARASVSEPVPPAPRTLSTSASSASPSCSPPACWSCSPGCRRPRPGGGGAD